MDSYSYASPIAGLPPQSALHTQRAVFTNSYAFIPRGVMRDIVTSYLPHWSDTRAWIIARPVSSAFASDAARSGPAAAMDRRTPKRSFIERL